MRKPTRAVSLGPNLLAYGVAHADGSLIVPKRDFSIEKWEKSQQRSDARADEMPCFLAYQKNEDSPDIGQTHKLDVTRM